MQQRDIFNNFKMIQVGGRNAMILLNSHYTLSSVRSCIGYCIDHIPWRVRSLFKTEEELRAIYAIHPPSAIQEVAAQYPGAHLCQRGNILDYVDLTPIRDDIDNVIGLRITDENMHPGLHSLLCYVQDWSMILCKAMYAQHYEIINFIVQKDLYYDMDAPTSIVLREGPTCYVDHEDYGGGCRRTRIPITMRTLNQVYPRTLNTWLTGDVRATELEKWAAIWHYVHFKNNTRTILSAKHFPRLRGLKCRVHRLPVELIKLICLMF